MRTDYGVFPTTRKTESLVGIIRTFAMGKEKALTGILAFFEYIPYKLQVAPVYTKIIQDASVYTQNHSKCVEAASERQIRRERI